MHQLLQHLVNLLNQMLAALFAILLAIWLKLRNARWAKGLTIEEAAELLGVAPGTYSRWERLRQKPHPAHRLLLLKIFGKDIEEIDLDGGVPDEFLPPSYWNYSDLQSYAEHQGQRNQNIKRERRYQAPWERVDRENRAAPQKRA